MGMYMHLCPRSIPLDEKIEKEGVLGSDKIASVLGTNWSQRSP